MVGAIDVATNAIETPTEVAATLRGALDFVDVENSPIYKLYGSIISKYSKRLNALSAGAEIIRKELGL
jgi:5-methyltetrahydropteroyltriglutamate--homocysteine methyltransferase